MEIYFHFVQELVLVKQLEVKNIPYENQLADVLTKLAIQASRFVVLKVKFMVLRHEFERDHEI